MAQVSVTLVRADTNQEFDVELPDDAPLAELLPALVKELGLPQTGPDGNQVAYELSNKRTGREYKEGETLGGVGTKTGDSLLLTSTFVAGAIKTETVQQLVCDICESPYGKPNSIDSPHRGIVLTIPSGKKITVYFSDDATNPRSLPENDCTCPGLLDVCPGCRRDLLTAALKSV